MVQKTPKAKWSISKRYMKHYQIAECRKKEVRYWFTTRPLFHSAFVCSSELCFVFVSLCKFYSCACLRWSEATPTCIKTSTRLNAIYKIICNNFDFSIKKIIFYVIINIEVKFKDAL